MFNKAGTRRPLTQEEIDKSKRILSSMEQVAEIVFEGDSHAEVAEAGGLWLFLKMLFPRIDSPEKVREASVVFWRKHSELEQFELGAVYPCPYQIDEFPLGRFGFFLLFMKMAKARGNGVCSEQNMKKVQSIVRAANANPRIRGEFSALFRDTITYDTIIINGWAEFNKIFKDHDFLIFLVPYDNNKQIFDPYLAKVEALFGKKAESSMRDYLRIMEKNFKLQELPLLDETEQGESETVTAFNPT